MKYIVLLILLFTTQAFAASSCSVYVTLHMPDGDSCSGAQITASLIGADTAFVADTMFLATSSVAHAAVSGFGHVWLVPNAQIDTTSYYRFHVEYWQGLTRQTTKEFDAYVPDSASVSIQSLMRSFGR